MKIVIILVISIAIFLMIKSMSDIDHAYDYLERKTEGCDLVGGVMISYHCLKPNENWKEIYFLDL